MLNKKILAAALVGVLFAGNAAAVDLTATTPAAATFAQELVTSTSSPVALSGAGTAVTFNAGFAIPNGATYYLVFSVDNSAVKINTVALADATTAGTTLTPVIVSGVGTDKVVVSVSPSAAVPATDKITATVGLSTSALTSANVAVSLYETASNAAGGVSALASATGPYLSYGPSLKWAGTANTVTADVASANAPFAQFLPDSTTGTTATVGVLTSSTFGLALTGATKADSTAFTGVSDLLGAGSTVVVSGAFDAVNGVTGASVMLGGASVVTDGQTATSATFAAPTTTGSLTFNVPSTAKAAIAAGAYSAKLVATAATGYQAPVVAPMTVGTIVHNGSTLQAPLVQIPTGWISRLALTNTSNVDAPYTIAVVNEAGQTTTTGNLTGTVPANSVKIIDDLSTVYSGNNRAALTVNLAAPDNSVQGVYQIVNPTSGSISNYVLARPAK